MSTPSDCPARACWQALLGDTLPPEQRERCEQHLETCPACQEHLDRSREQGGPLRRLGRQLGDPTTVPADPTLSQFLERLHGVKSPLRTAMLEPADLYFLHPSDELGVLGTLGAYEVYEVIGQGGMGVVLKALEPALHRLVAIKVMAAAVAGSAVARRRFTREAQAAAAVCHDHVVTVHGVHEEDGLPYLVMQYVPGESLQERLDRSGPLELVEIVRIGLQTAQGLAAAHAQGLIHRDIKPANLLLENGLARVKITDFGLARMTDDVGLTQNGVVAGTPEYMAPEQARGEVIDHRADLFSLGSVLYATCTGRPPFRGSTAMAVLLQVGNETPTPIRTLNPDMPAWLEALIARLMAKDPAKRFQSAAEVAGLLEGYLAHLRQPATVSAPELPFVAEASESKQSPGKGRSGFAGWLQQPNGGVLVGIALTMLVVGLTVLELAKGLPGQNLPAPGQELPKKFYQDFRGSRPLHPALNLVGPDADEVARFEAEGLRITLPATRPVNHPVEVATTFALVGDFEITATYELLSANQPVSGYGVGVSLNVADNNQRNKFAKVARAMLVKDGSVFHSQSWNNALQRSYRARSKPTESRLGQLRLVRKGSSLRYLAADGLGGDYKEIDSQDNFGTDDLAHVHLVVADSGSPGNAVDARLVDFTIRAANLTPDPTPDAAPAADPAPAVAPERKPRSRSWLVAAAIMGLLLLSSLVVCLVMRRRRPVKTPTSAPNREESAKPETAAPSVSVRCSGCGKALKVKLELAGKKVKCPQCGKAVRVPPTPADEAYRPAP